MRTVKTLGAQVILSVLSWCGSYGVLCLRRTPRLIWVFAGRTLILLVLSCHASYEFLSNADFCHRQEGSRRNLFDHGKTVINCGDTPRNYGKPKFVQLNSCILSMYTEWETWHLVFVKICILNEIIVHLYFLCWNFNDGSLRHIEKF